MRKCILWVGVLVLLTLNGCLTVGPDYYAPKLPETGVRSTRELYTAGLDRWWTTLKDPELTVLVEETLQNNLDLKSAVAAVRAARARLGIEKAALGPQLDASGNYTRNRSSDKVKRTGEYDLYHTGFDASWEIDLFGGTRRSVEAAVAGLEAQDANRDDVQVSLAAETAQSYVLLRAYQQRLRVALGNLELQRNTFNLLQSRFNSGLSDELALLQSRYNLESTRATIPQLKTGVEESLNALAILTGVMPGTLHERLNAEGKIPVADNRNVIGIPADLLRRRPDVRRAERELAAQTARIGAATADLYPKFTLIGSIGIESLHVDSFGDSGTEFYSFGPGIRWALFHSGSIRQNIKLQEARQEQYLSAYEKTILTAVQETRNALTGFRNEQQRIQALDAAVSAARTATERAEDQYKNGLSDFENVLDSQRSLLTYEDQLVQSQSSITRNLIRLYKALGGGWEPESGVSAGNEASFSANRELIP
jgi:NodT family efflux transporter outer membrane factor (OMF) lipoprotein